MSILCKLTDKIEKYFAHVPSQAPYYADYDGIDSRHSYLKATKVSKNEETMTVEYAYHLYHF